MKSSYVNTIFCSLLLLVGQTLFAQVGTPLPYKLSANDLNNSDIFYYKNSSSIKVSGSDIELSSGTWNVTRYVDMALADVPGTVSATFSLGTGSAFDKTTRIYASTTSDFASARLVAERVGGTGTHQLSGLLNKDERYIRIWFKNPDWSSTNCKLTGLVVTKSCDASVKVLAGFSDSEQVLQQTFNAVYSNIGGSIRIYSDSPNFTIEPTSIALGLGDSGETPIQVTFSPKEIGTLSGNIILEDTTYPASRAVVAVTGVASIPTPTDFVAGTATFSTIPISWSEIPGVSSYVLEVYEMGNAAPLQTVDLGAIHEYTVANLSPSTSYTFKLRAMLEGVYSGYAVLETETQNMTPNLRVENLTENSFRVIWDAVVGVDQYVISVIRMRDGLKFYDQVSITNPYIDVVGLDNGALYEVQLVASAGAIIAPMLKLEVTTPKLLPILINSTTGVDFDWLKPNNVNTTWESNGLYFKRDAASVVVAFQDIPSTYSVKLFVSRGTATLFDTYPNMYVEVSADGVNYSLLHTFSEGSPSNGKTSVEKTFTGSLDKSIRFMRVRCSGDDSNAWGYMRELSIAPLLPVALDATDIKGTSFVANWQAITDASDYSIDLYKKDTDGIKSYVSGWYGKKVGNVTSVEISDLERGVEYFYAVRAWFDTMVTNRSNEIAVKTSLPIVEVEGELVAFQTVYGVPSEPQSVLVNSHFLETEITITAPQSFSVSLDGKTYDNSVTMLEGVGQTLYVKLEGTAIQSYSGNLLIQTKGIPGIVIPITGSVAKSLLEVTAPRQKGDVRRGQTIGDIEFAGGYALNNLGDTIPGVFKFVLPEATELSGGADQEFDMVFIPNASNLYQQGQCKIYITVLLSFQSLSWDQTFEYMSLGEKAELLASTSSGLPVRYVSSDSTIVDIQNDSIIAKKVGLAVITADQPGNSDYEPAEGVSIYIIVRDVTALDKVITSSVMIYPNPVMDDLFVKAEAIDQIVLFDLFGRIIKAEAYSGESTVKFNVSDLPRGSYMLYVKCKDGAGVKTVIKY